MDKFLLAIDIGNTMISSGIMKDNNVVQTFQVETTLKQKILRHRLKKIFLEILKKYAVPEGVVICSVVPSVSIIVGKLVQQTLHKVPLFVGKDMKVPIKNNYDYPSRVGQDRLVCAYAAKELYGYPAIIVDLGTAITFDVVSDKGEYEGGIIIPGIRLSAESLFQKTALLPKVETIKGPKRLIGKNTQESILSGIFYGFGTMIAGLIGLISSQFKRRPNVILTGGYTKLMHKFIKRRIDKVNDNLVFAGMYLLYHRL